MPGINLNLDFYIKPAEYKDKCIYCGSDRLIVTKKRKTEFSEQLLCVDCKKTMSRWLKKGD